VSVAHGLAFGVGVSFRELNRQDATDDSSYLVSTDIVAEGFS
jgi:hypothetical protein